MQKLKIGYVVQLSSGGPEMTVTALGPFALVSGVTGPEGEVECSWFVKDVLKRDKFSIDYLTIIKAY